MKVTLNELLSDDNQLNQRIESQIRNLGYLIIKINDYDNVLRKIVTDEFHQYIRTLSKGTDLNTFNVSNLYPSSNHTSHEFVQDFYFYMNQVKKYLIEILDKKNFDPNQWDLLMKNDDSAFSYIYFPKKVGGNSIASHVDSTLFTILGGIQNEGLEVLVNNKWEKISKDDDEVVIINGALLHLMSNKAYVPLYHRVVYPKEKVRKTIALLIQPKLNHVMTLPQSNKETSYINFHHKRLLVM